MINYQKELDKLIQNLEKEGKVPKLLIHSCCAPCSSYVLEYLSQYFEITVLYYGFLDGKNRILTDIEKNISRLEITIHEGKNRQVRKMCEAIGKKVLALHRAKIGNLGVKDLKLGTWRYMTKREVEDILK